MCFYWRLIPNDQPACSVKQPKVCLDDRNGGKKWCARLLQGPTGERLHSHVSSQIMGGSSEWIFLNNPVFVWQSAGPGSDAAQWNGGGDGSTHPRCGEKNQGAGGSRDDFEDLDLMNPGSFSQCVSLRVGSVFVQLLTHVKQIQVEHELQTLTRLLIPCKTYLKNILSITMRPQRSFLSHQVAFKNFRPFVLIMELAFAAFHQRFAFISDLVQLTVFDLTRDKPEKSSNYCNKMHKWNS